MAALCLRDWLLLLESEKSKTALIWQLNLLIDALGDKPVDQISTRDIRRAALDLRAERVAIEQARADGAPLMQTVKTRAGRSYEARRRGVDNNGINKDVKTVARVLAEAKTPSTSSTCLTSGPPCCPNARSNGRFCTRIRSSLCSTPPGC
jgi:hypothetical protein